MLLKIPNFSHQIKWFEYSFFSSKLERIIYSKLIFREHENEHLCQITLNGTFVRSSFNPKINIKLYDLSQQLIEEVQACHGIPDRKSNTNKMDLKRLGMLSMAG